MDWNQEVWYLLLRSGKPVYTHTHTHTHFVSILVSTLKYKEDIKTNIFENIAGSFNWTGFSTEPIELN